MAKVLVTGGAGFIGSHLVRRLLAAGDSVVVIDDLSTGVPENLAPHPHLLLIRDGVNQLSRHEGVLADVELVFHLAARISGPESLTIPDAYFETNVLGLLRVLELCRKLRTPRFVFASTSGIYGNAVGVARTERDLPAPRTVYALTKLNGEHLLDVYREQCGYDDVSLRLFNVYGPRQSRHHPYANVTCKFSWAAANGSSVALYGDGQQTRDFVYVDDVVDAMVTVARTKTRHRVYNVGTGAEASIAAMLDLVQEISGRRLALERHGPWPNDIRAIRADVTLLKEDVGFAAKTSLRDGLARTIEYFRGEPG